MARKLPVYILAGGHSSRFGSDKARVEIEGSALIRRVADALGHYATRIAVIAKNDGQYDDMDLRTIGDSVTDIGPAGGLMTALEDLDPSETWLLLASCDIPVIKGKWVDALLDVLDENSGAQVVAFKPDRWQPLLALYHRSILAELREQLAGGERAMWRLLESVATVSPYMPPDWPHVFQINSPDDLARWKTTTRV